MDETSRWLAGGCRTGPLVVVGTGGGADSLYTFRVSPARTAALPVGEPLKVGLNPAFVSAAKGKGVLYVAHEGAVSAVAVDPRAATLSPRGHAQDANGAGTAYVECDGPKCRHVLAANYAGGSVCVLPVLPDGSLGPATDAKHHAAAAGALKPHLADRQEAAHPHSIRARSAARAFSSRPQRRASPRPPWRARRQRIIPGRGAEPRFSASRAGRCR